MMHGPCGPEFPNAPCMVNGKCSKHYPKDFCAETSLGEDGYSEYARPDNGRTYNNPCGKIFDNSNVVPYNPYPSAKHDCHINVEVCASVKVIKYIHKYIYKGHGHATVDVGEHIDEILGPIKLVHWRLFGILQNSPCMKRSPLSIICPFTFQISKPSISMMMMMIWWRLWTMMPLKRVTLLSGLLQITQSLQQSSIPISTPIALFERKSPESRSHTVELMSLEGCTLFTHLQENAFIPGCC